ncbi:NAD(P)-dependent oxidoreductase [Antarctobacter sp.]|uniref:NAD(P)-dependent oxidoreductase n=1 Tax=Antarctobacter sp. TaxID=1872577 RepID=UPI003A8D89B4
MSIGFIGLGDMGGALARRLQLSHPLVVFDLNAEAIARLEEKGATAAKSLPQMAADCDTIFLCLPKSEHVRRAIFGAGGLAEGLRPGTLLIDQTSGDPKETRDMAQRLAARDVTLVDAPVSGGPAGADAGKISIMVGAEKTDFATVLPILNSISPNVFHAGGSGTGHAMKLVNNLLSGAQRLLSLECLALASNSGIAPTDAVRILLAGGARNVFLESQIGPIIEKGEMNVGFTLELMHKDVDLACRAGNDVGMPMFFGATTREMYRLCMTLLGGDQSVMTSALAIDQISGSRIVPEGVKA